MSRKPRLVIPGVPMHVIQRGNNRSRCFEIPEDYWRYRTMLGDESRRTGCAIHAYALMTNHVHLLVTPARPNGIASMMQRLGSRYVRYFNDRHGRTGTLWEGRYRAGMIDSDRYLLACSRYIDLNPVRASIVQDPAYYLWSSYKANVGACSDPVLTRHPLLEGLGSTDSERAEAYRALILESVPEGAIRAIRQATRRGTTVKSESDSDPRPALPGPL